MMTIIRSTVDNVELLGGRWLVVSGFLSTYRGRWVAVLSLDEFNALLSERRVYVPDNQVAGVGLGLGAATDDR